MANHVAVLHRRDDAIVDVQIGTADGAGRDLDDRIPRMLDHRIRHCLAAHVAFAVPTKSLHLYALLTFTSGSALAMLLGAQTKRKRCVLTIDALRTSRMA